MQPLIQHHIQHATNIATAQKFTENNFKLEHENSEWLTFSSSVYTVSSSNIMDNTNFERVEESPLLDKLQKHAKNWTPKEVVFTTVDEAHSGIVQDVGKFYQN